ncbi:hypothetical protein BO70DRAFT_254787, partial [Aspergillus heteromorphus CBS 117.55]
GARGPPTPLRIPTAVQGPPPRAPSPFGTGSRDHSTASKKKRNRSCRPAPPPFRPLGCSFHPAPSALPCPRPRRYTPEGPFLPAGP